MDCVKLQNFLKQNINYKMKISKKTNLYLMLILYLFAIYSINLAIWIISDLIESPKNCIIISTSFLLGKTILPLFFWLYLILGGKLIARINRDYEN